MKRAKDIMLDLMDCNKVGLQNYQKINHLK